MASQQRQFYVTLPSTSSELYYGRQSPGRYRTRLAVPLTLDPQRYEVGVTDILLPATVHNVPECHVTRSSLWIKSGDVMPHSYSFSLPRGHYKSVSHLVEALNRASVEGKPQSPDVARANRFAYDGTTGRVTCYVGEDLLVTFDEALGLLLGFGHSKVFKVGGESVTVETEELTHFKGRRATGKTEANVNRLTESLSVYSDIVASQRVGTHVAPLLRHIGNAHERGEDSGVVEECFDNVQYVPLQRGNIESIDIYYADSTGREPSYERGSSMIKLHFRQKK